MAQLRQDSTVGIQSAGGFQSVSFGMDKAMEAQGWAQLGQGAQTIFDLVKSEHDQDAVRQAQIDAPAMIQRDGKGMVIPPATFSPKGGWLNGQAYVNAYKSTAFNTYMNSVESDHSAYLGTVGTKYPTDVEAARKDMEERTNATVAGLEPSYAPIVTLRLNSLNGQMLSRINANVISEQNKVNEQNAQQQYEGTILQATQLAKTPAVFDEATMQANGAMLADRWKLATQSMKNAGWSDARIAKAWQDAKVKTEISRDVQVLREDFITAPNLSSAELVNQQLQWLATIDRRRKELGPDGPAYAAAMQQAFSEYTMKNGLRIQSNDNAAVEAESKRKLEMMKGFSAAGAREGASPQELLGAFTAERNAVFTDASLSTAQRIRRLATYDSVIAGGKSELNTYAADQMTRLATQAMDPATPPERSKAMVQELRQIVSDPQTTAWLSTGVRNYGERAVAAIASNDAKTDMVTTMSVGTAGKLPPADIEKVSRAWLDRGWVSDAPNRIASHAELAQWIDGSRRAYAADQIQSADASAAVRDFAAGGVPSDARRAALVARLPAWQTPDGKALDFTNPEHVRSLAARTSLEAGIPAAAVDQFKAVQMGDPTKAKAAADAFMEVRKVYAAHGFDTERTTAVLNTQLGAGISSFFQNVDRYGPAEALKLAIASPNSVSQQGGQSPPAVATDVDAAIGTVATKLGQGGNLGVWDRLAGPSKEQEAYRRALGDQAPSFIGMVGHNLNPLNTTQHSGQFQSIAVAPDFQAQLARTATVIMKQSGRDLKTANPASDPNEIAVLQAIETHRNEMEIAADPNDPAKGIMQFKGANKRLSEAIGRPVGDLENNGFSLGLYRATQQSRRELGMPEEMVAPFDPRTVRLQRFQNEDGTGEWVMAAQLEGNMGAVRLMTLQDNDPRLSAYVADVHEQAARDLTRHWYGKTPQPDGRSQAYVTGSVLGRGWGTVQDVVGKTISGLLADTVRNKNVDLRLTDPTYLPKDGHYTKRLTDAIFGTDFAQSPRPMIGTNPLSQFPGLIPSGNADWKKVGEAMRKANDPDLEERARNLEILMQLKKPR